MGRTDLCTLLPGDAKGRIAEGHRVPDWMVDDGAKEGYRPLRVRCEESGDGETAQT